MNVDNANYLKRIVKNADLSKYYDSLSIQEQSELFDDINKIYKILHIKNKVDKDIVGEISNLIDIGETNELGVVSELNKFNSYYKNGKKIKKK